jgi:hypothetical protein
MNEPIQTVIQSSLQIAWNFLSGIGELENTDEAGRHLLKSINDLVAQGERRKLMLANRAIDAYRHFKINQKVGAAA